MVFGYTLLVLWLGFVLAISFMEAPVKFRTPSLDKEVGLDVGRLVFKALNYAEFLLGTSSLIVWVTVGVSLPTLLMNSSLLVILGIQSFGLYPQLNAQVKKHLKGEVPPRTKAHSIYIILETVKVIGLILLLIQIAPNLK